LVSGPVDDRSRPDRSDPWATAYPAVASAIAVIFLLIAAISLLLALRKWVLPASGEGFGSGFFGSPIEGEEAALRSLLGAGAFAVPGILVLLWHRRRDARAPSAERWDHVGWSESLFLHLVALISLVVAMGAAVAVLTSLRDSVWPQCFPAFTGGGIVTAPPLDAPPISDQTVTPPPLISIEPPISIPLDPGFAPEPDCFPETSEALRGALDAGIVAVVAGGTWAWFIGRARRQPPPPPGEE
jgi:hypothetical protein